MDTEPSGARMLVLELHQNPFSFTPTIEGSEIDPFDLSIVRKSDWRIFRRNVSQNLSRELRRFESRFGEKKQVETGVSKLVRDNPSFDPVFMKV